MRWFKHETDARNSLKLRKVRRKYGADGYAIYWFCLEAIAYGVDKDNLTFDLKEDAETIGFELSIQEKRVEEIMNYMVEIDLFENCSGIITCLKLAERLDKSMTNSPRLRKWLDAKSVMTSADDIMTLDDTVNTCHELDKNRLDIDKEYKDLLVKDKSSTEGKPEKPKFVFSENHMKFAKSMYSRILDVMPKTKKPNFEKWAHEIRIACDRDKIEINEFWRVFAWANKDSFWKTNILSPAKLREKFPQLQVKANEISQSTYKNNGESTKISTPLTEGQRLRIQLNEERIARGEDPIDWGSQ